jgi:hypothetical protein
MRKCSKCEKQIIGALYFTLGDRPEEAWCSAECRDNWVKRDLLFNPRPRKVRDIELADMPEDIPLSPNRKERDDLLGVMEEEDPPSGFTLYTKRKIRPE